MLVSSRRSLIQVFKTSFLPFGLSRFSTVAVKFPSSAIFSRPQISYSGGPTFVSLAFAAAASTMYDSNKSLADEPSSNSKNPLWPAGISTQDVDELVEEIVKDPDISISGIPDALERQIYRSTILLTVNTVYQYLAESHGKAFLNQKIQLRRSKASSSNTQERALRLMRKDNVDEQLLEDFAERLVSSGAVDHLVLVPGSLEKQVFKSTLKVVFRVLDLLTSNFRITVCGHEISLLLEKSDDSSTSFSQQAAKRVALTEINLVALQNYARQMGAVETNYDDGAMNFAQRILQKPQREIMARLNACLYALILGILDDVFSSTVLSFFSDEIRFDLVKQQVDDGNKQISVTGDNKLEGGADAANEQSALLPSQEPNSPRDNNLLNASFGTGLGVGLAAGALLAFFVTRN